MGVYIRGMEMPKYFQQAEVGLDADGNGVLLVYPEGGNEPNVYSIIPVPPHGALMDRDDFFATCPELVDGYKRITDDLVVLPAEEGEA